jgi:hypothetical protein
MLDRAVSMSILRCDLSGSGLRCPECGHVQDRSPRHAARVHRRRLLIAAGSFIVPSVAGLMLATQSASWHWIHPFAAVVALVVLGGVVMIATAWLVVGLAGRGHRLWITALAVGAGLAEAILAVATALAFAGPGLWS